MQRVIDAYAAQLPTFVIEATELIGTIDFYAAHPREQVKQFVTAAMKSFQADLNAGTETQFAAHWEQIGKIRAEQGAALDHLLSAVICAEQVFNQFFLSHFAVDAEARAWWSDRLHRIIYSGVVVLAHVFLVAREQMIRDQALQLREISTPIIPLHQGMLVVPLIGTIDSHRAGQIMEILLDGIARQRATVVLLDITGVPMVDTQVANYLIQAARAARLLGSEVVLVGIGPEIAQTIVQLGIDLSDIATRSNLETGIEYALRLRGLAILPVERGAFAPPA